MRHLSAIAAMALSLLAATGCASAPPRPASADTDGASYLKPVVRPGELAPREAKRLDEAWAWLQAGKWSEALRRIRPLEKGASVRPAVAITRAYCILRSGRHEEARKLFDAVLLSTHNDPPPSALVGASLAATRRGLDEDALGYLARAVVVAPGDGLIRRLHAETKLQLTEAWVAEARRAWDLGDADTAARGYEKTLSVAPEIAGVRLEFAEALLARQEAALAAEILGADPTGDRAVQLRLGQILQGLQEYEPALEVFRRLAQRFPGDPDARRGIEETHRSLELQRLPEELRRLPSAPRATRADLAALLLLRVPELAAVPPGEPRVAVDVSGSWAREHIVRALALRILDVFPNHTFQPGTAVRRGDLATALAQVMDLLGVDSPPGPTLPDVSRTGLQAIAISRVVASGLMAVTEDGSFEPWRVVSGRELWDVGEALTARTARRREPPPPSR